MPRLLVFLCVRVSKKGHTTVAPLFRKSIAQTRSAFRSSASQNLTAVGCCHSLTETMFHFAMPLLGLVGTKHETSSFHIGVLLREGISPLIQPDNDILYTNQIPKVKAKFHQSAVFFNYFFLLVVYPRKNHHILYFSAVNGQIRRLFFRDTLYG